MNDTALLILGLVLAASIALNGHMCKRVGEVEERERGKDAAIAQLKKEPEWLSEVLAGLNSDKADIDSQGEVRRHETKIELRTNPEAKSWGDARLPDRVRAGGGLLGKASPGDNQTDATGSTDPGTAISRMGGGDKR